MKKKILSIAVLLFVFLSGAALASSINGDWQGSPIVKLFSNGKPLNVSDNPPIILNNHTMIPLYMLKDLGVALTWHQDTYSVDIKLPEKIKIVHPKLTQVQLDKIAESVSEVFAVDDTLYATKQGSGVLLDGGIFLTNEHVGGFSKAIQFTLNRKTINNHGVTLFRNKQTDLYAIQTSETNGLKYTIELPKIGDIIYAIGYPKEKFAITEGTVTGIITIYGRTMIEFDAPIDNGNSGGALVDDQGEVIGIVTSGYTGTNKNQALPLSYMQDELNKLK